MRMPPVVTSSIIKGPSPTQTTPWHILFGDKNAMHHHVHKNTYTQTLRSLARNTETQAMPG